MMETGVSEACRFDDCGDCKIEHCECPCHKE